MRIRTIIKAILLGIASSELACQAYEIFHLRADSYDLRHNMVFHAKKNIWKYKPSITIISREKTGNITYRINDQGYRSLNSTSRTNNQPSALFVGDSVTFGLCSNTSIPNEFRKLTNNLINIDTLALPGLNPKDYYYQTLEYKKKNHYEQIFILAYMNDLTAPSIMDTYKPAANSTHISLTLAQKTTKIPEIILSFSALYRSLNQALRRFHYQQIRPIQRSAKNWKYNNSDQALEAIRKLQDRQTKENLMYLSMTVKELSKLTENLHLVYLPHESATWTDKYKILGNHLLAPSANQHKRINLEPAIRSLPSEIKKNLYCDGIHLTDAGNKITAKLLFKATSSHGRENNQ